MKISVNRWLVLHCLFIVLAIERQLGHGFDFKYDLSEAKMKSGTYLFLVDGFEKTCPHLILDFKACADDLVAFLFESNLRHVKAPFLDHE